MLPIASLTVRARGAYRSIWVAVVPAALLFVLLAQVARAMFPMVYEAFEDAPETAGAIALAVFAAPILAMFVPRRDPERSVVYGAIGIVAARLALQFVHPIPLWLVIVAVVVSLAGMTVVVSFSARWMSGTALVSAIVAGLAIDTAMRAPTRGWDLVWQGSVTAVSATVVLAAAAAVGSRRLAGTSTRTGMRIANAWVIGPYLMLQLVFVQNIGYVSSQAEVSFEAATLIVLAGDVAALVAVAWAAGRTVPFAAGVAVAVATVLGWLVHDVDGVAAIALVLVLQVLASASLARSVSTTVARASTRRVVVMMTAASLAFIALALLWQIDVRLPLPFPRQFVSAAAAAFVGLPAVVNRRTQRAARQAWPTPAIAVVVALAVLVPSLVWLERPAERTVPATTTDVRAVSFNVRGAVGPDGQIDADAIAGSIQAFEPDVVVLQEVTRGWVIHGTVDLLAYLHDRLDMAFVFEPAADQQFGNAIFTRLPFAVLGGGALPAIADKQTRSYVAVRVDVAGTGLVVVGMQLETRSPEQITALLDAWGGASPAIVAGDPNIKPVDDTEVELFTDAGLADAATLTGNGCDTTSAEPTGPCDRPDWVLVTSDVEIGTFRIGDPSASDHLPIYVEVSVPAA